jgi:hypothetical protein
MLHCYISCKGKLNKNTTVILRSFCENRNCRQISAFWIPMTIVLNGLLVDPSLVPRSQETIAEVGAELKKKGPQKESG